MTDPLVPNFKPGVGRLTTDRFDFQKHVNGEDFQHSADIITVDPPISVDGGPALDNIQAVLEAINALVPQVIPDATSSVKGLIKLSGDLAGNGSSAATPRVSGLQGFPITTSTPNDGDLLTYDAGIPGWKPAALSSTFSSLTVSGLTTLNGSLNATGGYSLSGSTGSVSSTGGLTLFGGTTATLSSTSGTVNISSLGSADINIKCLGASGNIALQTQNAGNVTIEAGSTGVLSLYGGLGMSISSGGTVEFLNGDVVIDNNLNIGSSSANTMTVTSTVFMNNGVTLGSSSSDVTTIKSQTRFSGTGRIQWQGIILNNANQTVDIRQYKYLVVPSGIVSIRTYTLSDSSTVDGDWFQIYNASSVNQTLAGAVSFSLGIGQTAHYVKISGTWTRVRAL